MPFRSFIVASSDVSACRVMVLPDSVTSIVLLPDTVTAVDPDVFETIVDVFDPPAPTVRLPSFVALPSASVPVMVRTFVEGFQSVVLMPAPWNLTICVLITSRSASSPSIAWC